jgi:L-ascorbate metabolism protein UlaG (beta-lactamase superfamily)
MKRASRREFVKTTLLAGGGILTAPHLFAKGLGEPQAAAEALCPRIEEAENEPIWACWIGQSTVLIKLGEKWVLTDPVFANIVGLNILGIRIGPRRILPPALTIEEIPRPDIVLLSHAHMDHMDSWTLERLTNKWPGEIDVLTATNTLDIIRDMAWKSAHEIDWGETTRNADVTIRALQVNHNGWRFPGERCRSMGYRTTGRSYNGYEIEYQGARIVFGGDTAYTDVFKNVQPGIDLAIMPIGSYEGYAKYHCNPEEALAMTSMMHARALMPVHHLTFRQSTEPIREPLFRLQKAIDHRQLHLAARMPGGTYRYTA